MGAWCQAGWRAGPAISRPPTGRGRAGGHDGGGAGAHLEALPVGVGLEAGPRRWRGCAVRTCTGRPGPRPGMNSSHTPEPWRTRMGWRAAVPAVEVAHDAHPLGVGRPHREEHPRDPVHLVGMAAQEGVGMPVPPLAEEVQVEGLQHRREGVGVHGLPRCLPGVDPAKAGMPGQPGAVALPLEQVGALDALHLEQALHDPDAPGAGDESPDEGLPAFRMAAQEGEGIVVAGGEDPAQVGFPGDGELHGEGAHLGHGGAPSEKNGMGMGPTYGPGGTGARRRCVKNGIIARIQGLAADGGPC